MIHPHQLRIGNWVLVKDKPVQVESIDETGINHEFYAGDNYGGGNSEYLACFEKWSKRTESVQPLWLTGEILKSCGFSYERCVEDYGAWDEYWIEGMMELKKADKDECFFYIPGVTQIQCLHQLQNLYYALTGEELEYKP